MRGSEYGEQRQKDDKGMGEVRNSGKFRELSFLNSNPKRFSSEARHVYHQLAIYVVLNMLSIFVSSKIVLPPFHIRTNMDGLREYNTSGSK